MALMPCCGVGKPDRSQATRSAAIEKQLTKDGKIYRETHRLLLLGAGESGKSTIVKQMQIINMQGFSLEERKNFIPDIFNNLREALTSMLNAMKCMVPPITFDNDDHANTASSFLDEFGLDCKCDFLCSDRFFDSCEALWKVDAIQECYARSNEYHLIDSAKYFLDRISILRVEGYLPDDQDILRCRVLSTQIREIKFKVNDALFHMFDVGGQRDQRRKWIQCFNDATAIVFVTSLNGFNLFLREDDTTNRLQESMNLFRQVWNNRFLREVSFILFLNKTDLLLEKVLENRFKIEDYFPSYRSYKPAFLDKQTPLEPSEFTKAKFFFRDRFLLLTQENGRYNRNVRLCFPHFTCAVDTSNIKKIFEDCRTMIQRMHLDRFGILTLDC